MADEEKNQTTPADSPAPDSPGDETAEEVVAETPGEEVAGEPPADEGDTAAEENAAAEAEEPVVAAEGGQVPAQQEPGAQPEPEGRRKRKRLPRRERPVRSKRATEKPAGRKPITRLPKPEHERGRTQERQGTVVSDGMDKTIVVKVDTIKAHAKYKKVVRRSSKFHAHDERNEAKVGDVVRIVETRPLSKQKRWRLAEIVEAAK